MKNTIPLILILFISACNNNSISNKQTLEILSKAEVQISNASNKHVAFARMISKEDPHKTFHITNNIDSLSYFQKLYDSSLEVLLTDSSNSKIKLKQVNKYAILYQGLYFKIRYHKDDFLLLKLDSNTKLPIDSGNYQLLLNESARTFNTGSRAVISEISWCGEHYFIEGIQKFSSSDTILQKGESYSVQLSLGSNASTPLGYSKIEMYVRKDGKFVNNSLWDTISNGESQYELLIRPKEIGNYSWKMDYSYLAPNGDIKTKRFESSFTVQK